jgi:hypothetical protein
MWQGIESVSKGQKIMPTRKRICLYIDGDTRVYHGVRAVDQIIHLLRGMKIIAVVPVKKFKTAMMHFNKLKYPYRVLIYQEPKGTRMNRSVSSEHLKPQREQFIRVNREVIERDEPFYEEEDIDRG